jgi:pro-apoptotic serine protease NMA111
MTSPIQTTPLAHGSVPTSASDVESPTGVQVVEYSSVFKQDEQSLDPWVRALHRVIKAIVTIKAKTLRCFDTEHASSFEGTGFVVDKKMGLILSNRHIVRQGPIAARAIFGNYEEIVVQQAYVDPVHDFGFFKYDPTKVKFAEVEEIELYPQGAKVGLEIKVCGNDAGEKLSILSATLARLDRAAPEYSFGYNDFNINYFQAASGTSGGSSGSPVLDIQGRAIALNAGASVDAASGFFLPLDPAVRALKFVQRHESVPRGTLQTIFIHSSYDELRRLGFPESAEEACRKRNKEATGLLTVSDIIPEGPGYIAGLEVGDILIECYENSYGKVPIEGFNQLWEIIDDGVDKDITLTVYRGQDRKDVTVCVQDLHLITPNTFLELGNGIFNPLSYQLARRYHMPSRGVYAAEGGIFNSADTKRNFLLTQLAGKPINSLEDLKRIYLSLPDCKRVGFQFFPLDGRDQKFDTVEIDHHFCANAQFTRTDAWKREVLPLTPAFESLTPLKRAPSIDIQQTAKAEVLRNALVMVECRIPYGAGVSHFSVFIDYREILNHRCLSELEFWLLLVQNH